MRLLSLTQNALLTGLCVLALAACSKGPDTQGHGGQSTAASSTGDSPVESADRSSSDTNSDSGDDAITQIDCAKIFKPGDATPILGMPAKISNYTMRDRSCELEASDTAITVYGGKGDDLTSKVSWNDATKSSESIRYAKLSGVGDEAYWRKDGLHNTVLSRKGDLWCSADGGTPAKTEADALKLGELCNKVYASGL